VGRGVRAAPGSARFANVTVAHGTLFWPDDELDWAPELLYEAARTHALVAT
jgi:hypothetical protein